jgi:hypothetical protein
MLDPWGLYARQIGLVQLQRSIRVQAEEDKRATLPKEPYKSLECYEEKDAAIFLRRDLEADLLLSTVLAHKLTVFYGRSGTAKTSLLLTRVLPVLEAEDHRVAYTRMLGDPATEVKAAVLGLKAAEQLSHLHADAASVEFSAGAFDAMIFFYTLEHLPRQGHEDPLRRFAA